MKKKIVTMLLAAAMVMNTVVPVLAAGTETELSGDTAVIEGLDVTVNSTVRTPTIKVKVPTSAAIMLNPYRLEVTADGEETNAQIICAPQTITNESEVGVAINLVDLVCEVGRSSDLEIKDTQLDDNDTDKKAFLYFEMISVDDGDFEEEYTGSSDYQLIISETEQSKEEMVILEAAEYNGTTFVEGTEAQFKIGGQLVAVPVDNYGNLTPWVDGTDTITVTMKFTFTPQAMEEE